MDAYIRIWDMMKTAFISGLRSLGEWLAGLGPAQQVLGLVMFALVVMLFALRRRRKGQPPGNRAIQFVFAMAIVMILAFGSTWVFAPNGIAEEAALQAAASPAI